MLANLLGAKALSSLKKITTLMNDGVRHIIFKNKITLTDKVLPTRPVPIDESQMCKHIKNDVSFLFNKDSKKSRIPLTPKKIAFRERLYDTAE
jgi:hypothetical protein